MQTTRREFEIAAEAERLRQQFDEAGAAEQYGLLAVELRKARAALEAMRAERRAA